MSITTRDGDGGETGLMFGRRLRKDEPRVHASGTVDELNSVLGVARACLGDDSSEVVQAVAAVQQDLVSLMGQLNTLPDDWERYCSAGYGVLGEDRIAWMDERIAAIEAELPPPKHWSMPGAAGHVGAAHLEVARTVCRRAERWVLGLENIAGAPEQFSGGVYLNRLSDFLWLLARKLES